MDTNMDDAFVLSHQKTNRKLLRTFKPWLTSPAALLNLLILKSGEHLETKATFKVILGY
jgi:hypothetical protein